MSSSRSPRRLSRILLAALFAMSLGPTALAEEGIEGGTIDIFPRPLGSSNLLEPIGNLLSGRASLIARGLDPSFSADGVGKPGDPGGNDLSTGPSPIMQGASAALVPFREPGPAFSSNVLVTRDFSSAPYQTEPHLAVDPADPDHLVLGTIDYGFPSTSSYVSLDGGESWEGPFRAPYLLDDLGSGGDPVLAIDRSGATYMTMISIGEEEFTVGPVGVSQLVSSIAVARSDDGGFTWPETISTARSRVSTDGLTPDRFGRLRGNLVIGFLDKPWIAVGPSPEDPTQDVLYVTYTDFETSYTVLWLGEVPTIVPVATQTTIRVVRSEDGGRSWSTPVAVSPTVNQSYAESGPEAPGVFGTSRTVQGSQPAVAPDGSVYVAWADSTDDDSFKGVGEIYVARSTDTGATFGTPVVASTFNEIAYRPRNAFFRFWASQFPQLAIGPAGEIYVGYAAKPADRPRDDSDVWLVKSIDAGQSWDRAIRLNDDDSTSPQFFPSIDVAPNGTVHAMWGDMRDDPNEARFHIYYTRSEDGGETWGFEIPDLDITAGDTRVTDFGSNPNRGFPGGRFIGDYFSLQATDEDAYMVWSDTRLGEYGAPNMKIGFARQRAIPAPELFLSPPSGPGGQQVTLQGFGYQPNLNVFVQLGDSTVAIARTDETGTFTNVLYMPITSEGAQTLTAVDESGSRASTSYFTEFGFGNIADAVADLSQQIDDLREQVAAGASAAPGASPAPGATAAPGASPAP